MVEHKHDDAHGHSKPESLIKRNEAFYLAQYINYSDSIRSAKTNLLTRINYPYKVQPALFDQQLSRKFFFGAGVEGQENLEDIGHTMTVALKMLKLQSCFCATLAFGLSCFFAKKAQLPFIVYPFAAASACALKLLLDNSNFQLNLKDRIGNYLVANRLGSELHHEILNQVDQADVDQFRANFQGKGVLDVYLGFLAKNGFRLQDPAN